MLHSSSPVVLVTSIQVVSNLGASDIDARLEELLVDGILYAFQEQVCKGEVHAQACCLQQHLRSAIPCDTLLLHCSLLQVGEDAHVMLNGFGTVINALGRRAKPYLPQVRTMLSIGAR
jgi:splicing factor 3B subunit 1